MSTGKVSVRSSSRRTRGFIATIRRWQPSFAARSRACNIPASPAQSMNSTVDISRAISVVSGPDRFADEFDDFVPVGDVDIAADDDGRAGLTIRLPGRCVIV